MAHPESSNKTIGSSTHRARAHNNVSAAKKSMQDLLKIWEIDDGQMLHAAQYMDSNGIMIFNNERRNEVSDNAFQKHSKYKIFRRKASE